MHDSTGTGRYDIRADGTVGAGKSSLNPLKVFTERGITLVVPGQKSSAENGQVAPIAPSEHELEVIHLDELQSPRRETHAGSKGLLEVIWDSDRPRTGHRKLALRPTPSPD